MFKSLIDLSKSSLDLSFQNCLKNVCSIKEKNETQNKAFIDPQTDDSIKEINFLQEENKKKFYFITNFLKKKAIAIYESLLQLNKIDKAFIDNVTQVEIEDNELPQFRFFNIIF